MLASLLFMAAGGSKAEEDKGRNEAKPSENSGVVIFMLSKSFAAMLVARILQYVRHPSCWAATHSCSIEGFREQVFGPSVSPS